MRLMLRRTLLLSALAPPAAPLRLGFSLYALGKLTLEEGLRVSRQIGYRGVELCLQPGWPAEPKLLDTAARRRTRAQMRSLGLELIALMDNMSLVGDANQQTANLNRIAAAARLGYDLAPGRTPVLETVLGGRPEAWPQLRNTMLAQLKDWAAEAAKHRITIAIKAHVSGAANQPERLLWLLDQVKSPWIKAAYDYSHFQLIGLDLAQTIRQLAAHTVFVHVKDASGDSGKFQFLLPGESGTTNYAAYLRELQANGYRGWVVPEVSLQLQRQPGYDGVAAARRCYQVLARAFAEAKLA